MRTAIALALVAVAILLNVELPEVEPGPPPELDLTAAFVGETAAEDAEIVAAMAEEIAEIIEYDMSRDEPILETAVTLDALRTHSREFLFRGESIGARHPRMRQIVGDYLTARLGTEGGEVTDEDRREWASAYREIARSARYVYR